MNGLTMLPTFQKGTAAPRILILTGRFGMGHCAAAEAIRQEVLHTRPGAYVRVVDVMDELFPNAAAWIYDTFGFLVRRCSWVYNLLNRAVGARVGAPLQKTVLRRLDALLNGIDLVIATMPVCSQYVCAYKRQRNCDIPLYTYITDVSVHDEWIAPGTDLYFAACDETRDALIARGIEADRIVVSGVPVRRSFRKAEAFSRDGRHVLIMGGGLGLIPEADALLEALCARSDIHVTVIAGHNQALLSHVQEQFPAAEAVGFTDRVSDYMRQADLIITKSGGVTTFEAIHTQTPMYILRPFLVQEVGNAHYIEANGMGWVGWQKNTDTTVNDVLALLRSPFLLARMRRNMRAVRSKWSPISPLVYGATRRCG